MAFQFNDQDGAIEFWRRVKERDASTEEERTDILLEMSEQGYMKRVLETQRSQEQIVQDWSKHLSILYLKGKDDDKSTSN